MRSPVFEFNFNFEKEKMLEDYERRISKGLGYRYLAGKSYEDRIEDEKKADYSKTTVVRLKSGIGYNEAKRFLRLFDYEDFICHYIGYGKNDFVDWHIDKRPKEYCINASRINIFLTGKSFTTFEEGNLWYDNAVINVMGAKHKYDNRGLGKRVMLQIAVKGITHDELCDNIIRTQLRHRLAGKAGNFLSI